MEKLIVAALITFSTANTVLAADDCAAKAAEKKLAGATNNSFMTKCEKYAAAK
jgi:hypothetical protein